MTEKERFEELRNYYHIKEKIGKNWKINNSLNTYLINRNWIYKWKQYINKDYLDKKHKIC